MAGIAVKAPRVVSGLAILAVATVAGLVSYQHIEDLSLSLHQTLLVARLMPFGVDGLITVGSVVLLDGGKLGWLGIVPGVAISLFANVESGIRYGGLAAVWAGIPAVSFALACFILERWVTGQKRPADTPQGVAETGTVADAESEPKPESDTPQNPDEDETVSARRVGMSFDEAAREFAAEIEACKLPGQREIRARAHTGGERARAIQEHLSALMGPRLSAPVDPVAQNGRAPART